MGMNESEGVWLCVKHVVIDVWAVVCLTVRKHRLRNKAAKLAY